MGGGNDLNSPVQMQKVCRA